MVYISSLITILTDLILFYLHESIKRKETSKKHENCDISDTDDTIHNAKNCSFGNTGPIRHNEVIVVVMS